MDCDGRLHTHKRAGIRRECDVNKTVPDGLWSYKQENCNKW